jgi:hypothetical protein
MAKLTPAGKALISEASAIVDDTIDSMLKRSPKLATKLNSVSDLLDSLRS